MKVLSLPFALFPFVSLFGQPGWEIATHSSASGDAYARVAASGTNSDVSAGLQIQYSFQVPETADYTIWVRYRTSDGLIGGIFASVDDNGTFGNVSLAGSSTWTWARLIQAGELGAGNHQLFLVRNTANVELDRFFLSPDPGRTPIGKGGSVPGFPDPVPYMTFAGSYGVSTNPDDDDDGDFRSNWIESKNGTNPAIAEASPISAFRAGNGQVYFDVPIVKATENREIRVMRTSNLSNWSVHSNIRTTVIAESADVEWVRVTVVPDEPSTGPVFYSLEFL